jgi:hypothetical protein
MDCKALVVGPRGVRTLDRTPASDSFAVSYDQSCLDQILKLRLLAKERKGNI